MPDGYAVPGPGTEVPGPVQISPTDARAWASAAARAATRVPAVTAEADAWTVRGWADIAVGCIAVDMAAELDGLGAFSGLDEVIRARRIASAGPHAARLRRLRRFFGPVPWWYPDDRPVAGRVRAVRPLVWRAADLVASFGASLMEAAARLPRGAPVPLSSTRQLAWGGRYRPSASNAHVTLLLPVSRRLARRTWMCLPGLPPPATAIAEVPSTATALAQQVWRGIHEGAHLDHLATLSRSRPHAPKDPRAPQDPRAPIEPRAPKEPQGHRNSLAPHPAEFGAGLMVAESYAMAVEILAAVECILAREGHAVWQLGAGLIERAARLPGGPTPAPDLAHLPTLAEVYVLGPLEVLTGGAAAEAVPDNLTRPLRARWQAACAAYQPANAFAEAAAKLCQSR